MASNALCTMIAGLNPFYIVASAVAQQVFAMAWFDIIVGQVDRYYNAADKGVRRFEYAIHRYPAFVVAAMNFLCSMLRTVVVVCIAQCFKGTTLMDYQFAAMATAVLAMTRIHRHFSCQRPLQTFITETAYEIVAAVLGAVVYFYMQENKV